MSTAFSNALAGLTADNTAINIVSGNLANLNTAGYKDVQVSFEDLVNESLSSSTATSSGISGTTVAQTSQQFTQGTLQNTGNPYDAAIQGAGFFVVQDPSTGATLYTRQGNFQVNASGQLVTANGDYVEGWNAVNNVLNTGGAATPITLPVGAVQTPVATQNFSVGVNLSSNASAGTTFSSPIQVYDAEGNSHTLTVSYTQTSAGVWSYAVTIPNSDLAGASSGGGSGAPTTTQIASGTLTFDGNGILSSPAPGAGIPISVPGLADGASTLNLNWNLYDSNGTGLITQDSPTSTNLSSTQDGAPSGQLSNMSIGSNGAIVANFSNGKTETVAQISLASILNPQSMEQVNGNNYAATGATAPPVIGVPGTGSRGGITGGALETSTVDIATEFTNLLTYERGYQANSKVITTEDQIIQQTVGLIGQA